jgi:predicted CoA-binding protein
MTIHDDARLREMLEEARVIAVVGHSDKPHRTSYSIAQYLRRAGYKVYPVNPTVAEIDGERSYASLAEVPEAIDIVDVFRRSEYLEGVVEDAILAKAKAVWGQLGVLSEAAVQRAKEGEMDLVMDRCIKIEHQRLFR